MVRGARSGDKFRRPRDKPSISSSTRTCPSQAPLAPMPMVGMAMVSVISCQRFGDRLDHHREMRRLRNRPGSFSIGCQSLLAAWRETSRAY